MGQLFTSRPSKCPSDSIVLIIWFLTAIHQVLLLLPNVLVGTYLLIEILLNISFIHSFTYWTIYYYKRNLYLCYLPVGSQVLFSRLYVTYRVLLLLLVFMFLLICLFLLYYLLEIYLFGKNLFYLFS